MSEGKSCCGGGGMKTAAPVKPGFAEQVALYRPLIVITVVSFLAAVMLEYGAALPLMDGIMGLFLCMLASLQLFDVRGYAATFAKYDPIAARIPAYGLAYPFILLALGLFYLAGLWPVATNFILFAMLAIGTIGVLKVIKRGESVRCACAGTSFALPVGRVTVAENVIMAAMALIQLYHYLVH